MAFLNIESSSIGYDVNNVQAALSNLNTHVIQDTIVEMEQSMSQLHEWVDSAWVGRSADQFKRNMEKDKEIISKALKDTYEVLKSEMYQIVNEMDNIDTELVKARVE